MKVTLIEQGESWLVVGQTGEFPTLLSDLKLILSDDQITRYKRGSRTFEVYDGRLKHLRIKPSEIENARSTMSDWALHVYQVLYFKELTSPYSNAIFTTKLVAEYGLFVMVRHNKNPEYTFKVWPKDTDEAIMVKVNAVIEAVRNGNQKTRHACCGLAKEIPCVCVAHFTCILHGEGSVGTHD